MPPKHITPEVKQRCAEMLGGGAVLTHNEVSAALGIGTTSIDRIMSDPEYRKIADDLRSKTSSAAAQFKAIVTSMMSATDDNGNPIHSVRKMGGDLYAKAPSLVDAAEADDVGDTLLPGVVLRFPNPRIPDEDAPVTFSEDDLVPG